MAPAATPPSAIQASMVEMASGVPEEALSTIRSAAWKTTNPKLPVIVPTTSPSIPHGKAFLLAAKKYLAVAHAAKHAGNIRGIPTKKSNALPVRNLAKSHPEIPHKVPHAAAEIATALKEFATFHHHIQMKE